MAMERIKPLEPPFTSELQEQFRRLMPPGMAPLSLFRSVARSPRAWKKLGAGSLLDGGPLSLREREIVIDRACARAGCEYEWGCARNRLCRRCDTHGRGGPTGVEGTVIGQEYVSDR